MKMEEVVDRIKLELSGYVLELEIPDATIVRAVNSVLLEISEAWDEPTMVTIPYSSCIDLTGEAFKEPVNFVVKVYRKDGVGGEGNANGMSDPVFMQQWATFGNGGLVNNLSDYVLNYGAWATMSKIRNTISTDMAFKEDKHNGKLYINEFMTAPGEITVEYVPKLTSVEDIKSEYWQKILIRMSVATVKLILGRIRTRFTQSNSLWAQDGDKMLEEANSELKEIRESLTKNANIGFPID